jgi:hypothetical protein
MSHHILEILMNKKLTSTAALLLGALALAGTVQNAAAAPGAIFSATGATINAGGPGFGSIADTFNQAGLSAGYTSGTTDFDAYVLGTTHSIYFTLAGTGYEWFGESSTTTATVTYDLGSVKSFDRVALWNEESSGIGLLDLLTSLDGVTYTSLASGLIPTDNSTFDYAADVFKVGTTARYVRFDMRNCPQLIPGPTGTFPACAIGEVAFRSSADVPEPAMLGLLGLGLVGLVGSRRRKAV